jgi:TPR repeat protein
MLHLAREPSNPLRLTSKPLVERNVPEAFLLLRRAALLGHGPSQLRVGQVHRTGFFDAKEAKKAEQSVGKLNRSSSSKWIRRTSSQGSSSSPVPCTDAEMNSTLAMHYLHLAARRGLPQADYEIAHEMLFKGGDLSPQHQRLAYAHTARALLGNAPFANGLMGKILEEGIGCEVNLKEAGEYYFKGRQEGDEWARKRSDYLLNEAEGVSAGTPDTYKKPTHADQKGAARRY